MFGKQFRISSSYDKTLLWLFLKKNLSDIKSDTGVDLAGGSMLNKRFFKTKKYIAVDINHIKLLEGKTKNPDAIVINDTLQNYLLNISKKPNLLVCVQTFGTNLFFEHEETFKVIKDMSIKLADGGSMIFNIGTFGDVNLKKLKDAILPTLNKQFHNVEFKYYGAFYKKSSPPPRWKITDDGIVRTKKKLNIKSGLFKKLGYFFKSLSTLSVAYAMYKVPQLRTLFGSKKFNLYCFCYKKKSTLEN
ncbi:hypothetical protein ACIJYF_00755 [Candidatus Pelagibacter bacterium nBUS_49]|uniref:hypothetical protein n=1 Tax=Candidatus Pelagibacter bacterium nBUS_49 TaxID=3374196 RepID=UPI003EBBA819